MTKVNKREVERNKRADAVCREIRYQMTNFGSIEDNIKLYELLSKWLKISTKTKYTRP